MTTETIFYSVTDGAGHQHCTQTPVTVATMRPWSHCATQAAAHFRKQFPKTHLNPLPITLHRSNGDAVARFYVDAQRPNTAHPVPLQAVAA